MVILAEVSDKIPTLAFYWILAIAVMGLGFLLARVSNLVGFGFAALLLLLVIAEIEEFDSDDPFWKAIREEKGVSYIVQSWLSVGISVTAVTVFSVQRWMKRGMRRPIALAAPFEQPRETRGLKGDRK